MKDFNIYIIMISVWIGFIWLLLLQERELALILFGILISEIKHILHI